MPPAINISAPMMPFTIGTAGAICPDMEDALYSRLQLIRLSGAPEDAVRFWIREGLLRGPEDRGVRQHLRFAQTEVKIAAFLREARSIGLNISAMRALVSAIREGVELFARFGSRINLIVFEHAIEIAQGTDPEDALDRYVRELPPLPPQFLAGLSEDEKSEMLARRADSNQNRPSKAEAMEQAKWLAANFPFDQSDLFWLGDCFCNATDVLTAWMDDANEWRFRNGHPESGQLPAASVIAFDWGRICAINWSQAGAL